MGVYLFNLNVLDDALWEDYQQENTSHDFGKDILPALVKQGKKVFAYPYTGYWVDVGTIDLYWQAHMDLLIENPPLDLSDRSWIIHTQPEERPPVRVAAGADIVNSLITNGAVISTGAKVHRSVLGPGVRVGPGAEIIDSIILTDSKIEKGGVVARTIIDKRVIVTESSRVGDSNPNQALTMIGKNSLIPAGMVVEAGAVINADVVAADYATMRVKSYQIIDKSRRLRHDL